MSVDLFARIKEHESLQEVFENPPDDLKLGTVNYKKFRPRDFENEDYDSQYSSSSEWDRDDTESEDEKIQKRIEKNSHEEDEKGDPLENLRRVLPDALLAKRLMNS